MKVGDIIRQIPPYECNEYTGYIIEVHDKHKLAKVRWFKGGMQWVPTYGHERLEIINEKNS